MELLIFTIRRLAAMISVLLGVAAICFFLVRLTPGDPVLTQLGQHAGDRAAYLRLSHAMGLDQPLWRQFLSYLWNATHGDFGDSITQPGVPVTTILGQGVPVTLELGGMATLLSLVVGIPLGVLAAVRRNRPVADYLNMGVLLVLYSIPPFIIIPVVWSVFSIALRDTVFHLPVSGWHGAGDPRYWVAPVVIYAVGLVGFFARSVRGFMLEVLKQDYMRTARAKGLSKTRIISVHALRNILLPLSALLGPTLAHLVTGAFIIEQLFSIPGVGNITMQSTFSNDYAVALATTLLLAAAVVIVNALTDIVATIADPRVTL